MCLDVYRPNTEKSSEKDGNKTATDMSHAHYTYMQWLWTSSVYRTWKILHIQVNILFSFFYMWSKNVKSHVFLDFQKNEKTFSRTMPPSVSSINTRSRPISF